MNINKIIVCAVSVASVGFANDSLFDSKENGDIGSVALVVKPMKRGRPAGDYASTAKSKPGVTRVLGDVTNTVSTRSVRDRKPSSKFVQDDRLDGQSEKPKAHPKATVAVLERRAIVKVKYPKSSRRSPAAVALVFSDSDNSGHTTPVEESISSRTSSFDLLGASSPVLVNEDSIVEMDRSFGDDFGFGFDFAEEAKSAVNLLASPAAVIAPRTPEATELDWRLAFSVLGKDATPFVLGGSGPMVYSPFDPSAYSDPLFAAMVAEDTETSGAHEESAATASL